MSYDYEISDIIKMFQLRKHKAKNRLITFGYQLDKDYIIERGDYNRETIKFTKVVYDQLVAYYSLTLRKQLNESDIKIDYIKRYIPEETETIDFLFNALEPTFQCFKQYKILTYRIDLYIKDTNIAIECDEFGHNDRNEEYEKKRENDIINVLGCKFIRFNPNSKSFKLSQLLSEIIKTCFVHVKDNEIKCNTCI
jgi:very-short-patch-repair endonuclease